MAFDPKTTRDPFLKARAKKARSKKAKGFLFDLEAIVSLSSNCFFSKAIRRISVELTSKVVVVFERDVLEWISKMNLCS
ncbi:hypothetical protein AK966_18745 [Vibrio sp. PID23_8]|nr:hypothetical protein AK965_18920 [Vibrio sp. PID17_43]RIZ50334.1 hypothetical protein AK966_18745 [Vibrio sp. PID23_8]